MKKPQTLLFIIATLLVLSGLALFFHPPWKTEPPGPSGERGAEVFDLKFGHALSPDSAQHVAAVKFAQIVHQRSGGRVKISVYPDRQLGNDHQMIEAARAGNLAIILPPTAQLSTLFPAIQFSDLPFVFPSREDAHEILDGGIGRVLLQQLDRYGLVGASYWEGGFKQLVATKAIRLPEDFQGLKVRIMKSGVLADQFKSLGAEPIPIDAGCTLQAIKDGAIDGMEIPLMALAGCKCHEIRSHVSLSNHGYLAHVLAFSQPVFDALPDDLRKLLLTTAREMTPFQRQEVAEGEKRVLQGFKDAGIRICTLTKEERRRFQVATAPVWEKYREQVGGDLLSETARFLEEKYAPPGQDEIIIGLDADLTLGSAPSGLAIRRGMELAVREINRQGGVLGKNLRIVARDHGGIGARGLANMKYFARLKNLAAVMGGLHSPVALAELDIIHQEQIIYLDPWAAATSVVENGHQPNYVFRLSVRDKDAGSFLVGQALLQYRRVALLLENTGWGQSNLEAMTSALAEKKLTPCAVEWFDWGEEDMSRPLARIEESGAEVVLLVANAPEGISVIKSMASLPRKIPILSHWGITGGYLWEQANQEMMSVDLKFLQTFSFLSPGQQKTASLLQAYCDTYGIDGPEDVVAPAGTAHAYDLVCLLAEAIRQAGRLDRAAIRAALERIDFFPGLVKDYSPPFTTRRHDALGRKDIFLARYDPQGRIVPVDPVSPGR